jgi:CRP/FNR family transcriptional regulator, cyclic AMP receptor protein
MSKLEDQLAAGGLQVFGCCEKLSRHGAPLLEHSPLLEDMTPQEADALGEAMLLVRARPGQVMIREGEAGDWMMLILKGTVDVTKQVGVRSEVTVDDILAGQTGRGPLPGELQPPQTPGSADAPAAEAAPAASRVAVLRPGAAIGEMSMLDSGLRYTTCTAIDEVEAGVLGARAIGLLIRDHPTVGAKLLVKITQLMAQRLRNTSNHLVRLLQKS